MSTTFAISRNNNPLFPPIVPPSVEAALAAMATDPESEGAQAQAQPQPQPEQQQPMEESSIVSLDCPVASGNNDNTGYDINTYDEDFGMNDSDDDDEQEGNFYSRRAFAKSVRGKQQEQEQEQRKQQEQQVPFSSFLSSTSASTSLPQSFLCPITMEVMKNPVMDLDGNTYERENILEWIRKTSTNTATGGNGRNDIVASSPITRNPLKKHDLIPNLALKGIIYQYMGKSWSKSADEYIAQQQQKELQQEKEQEEQRKKMKKERDTLQNRTIIRSFMNEISRGRERPIQLNENGLASFIYEHLNFVIEVPLNVQSFFLYCTLFDPKETFAATNNNDNNGNNNNTIIPQSIKESVYLHALTLNYLQQDTRGACVSIDKENTDEEVLLLSYSDRVHEITHVDFKNILENFIDTALKFSKEFKDMTIAKMNDRNMSSTDTNDDNNNDDTADNTHNTTNDAGDVDDHNDYGEEEEEEDVDGDNDGDNVDADEEE